MKSVVPKGLPTKILKLLKNDLKLQLTNIFNLSFSTGVFPPGLKIKKYSKKRIKKKEKTNHKKLFIKKNQN